MADMLVMLALSPTMEEGQLVKWQKSEGDSIDSGEVVAEVETDKATMELESFLEGTLLKRLVEEGASVSVGDPIAIIGEEGEDIDDLLAEARGGDDEAEAEDDDEGRSQDAATSEDEEVDEEADEEAVEEADEEASRESRAAPRGDDERIIASPLARKMAEEAGIDLADVEGSGPRGRIIKRDIEAYEPTAKPTEREAPPAFEPDSWAEDVEPQPLSGMRRTIARRLGESWRHAPHFFLEMSIEMDAVWELRKRINETLVAHDAPKISFNDIVVRACALALQDSPDVNVAFSDEGMRYFEGSHIGVAVAVEEGLVVPVIRDAESKTVRQIGAETRDLAERARNKKLTPEEMTGSTFSVSNLGMYGIDAFTAVLNPPEACILAVGGISKTPVVRDDDAIDVARIMRVTLSCDHRAVDGATGAEFLQVLKAYLEDPLLLLA